MKSTTFLLSSAACLLVVDLPALADQDLEPVSQRFIAATDEVPSFQRHVVPLLGKLGCNGRACHGSFQGQGGFRLSLFGYDFKMDHEGLVDRVDTDSPADSYALQKPTLALDHEGGQRMQVGSWEYNIFMTWIAAGAKPVEGEAEPLVKLHVTPSEIVFSDAGEQTQLRAIAEWADGTREDVTPLCRFQSNDTQIAEITQDGVVTSSEPGDSHVVVFYDNAVVPIAVMRPVSDLVGSSYPKIAGTTRVDELVIDKLTKLGIVPSDRASDAEFLRRVSLDLAGTLPTSDDVRQFLEDPSPEKRAAKIDELLETPAYAAWWATKLCDFTGNSDQQLANVSPNNMAGREWYEWMRQRVEDNVPYDQIVEGMVLATSRREGEDYRSYSERRSQWYHRRGENEFAEEPTMAHFWSRRNFRTSEDRAIGFAYTFLGIRIQCAQCHKHPFDQWSQDDFQQFEKFFSRTVFSQTGADRSEYQSMLAELGAKNARGGDLRRKLQEMLRDGEVVPFPEVHNPPSRSAASERRKMQEARREGRSYQPRAEYAKLLGGEAVDIGRLDDPREPLMEWMRTDPSRLFARAFVNRVWATYFNRGIVEPTDDLSLANPPSNEALLQYLAEGFIENGYDMKWVHRTMANSDTYQRTWKPNATNEHDERNFSRAIPRRIPAEVAYDAIQMATLSDERTRSYLHDLEDRAIALPSVPRGNNRYRGEFYALSVFGKSLRENNCDCERSSEPSLLQTIYLRNDQDLLAQVDRPQDGWLASVAAEAGWRSTESRKPARMSDEQEEKYARIQRLLERYRQQGASKRAIEKAEQRLKEFQRLRGDAADEEDQAGAQDPTPASDTARTIVEDAYLRTLSRYPTEEELQISLKYLEESSEQLDGVRSLLWSLLNTKEFIVNH